MRINDDLSAQPQRYGGAREQGTSEAVDDRHMPRKPTFAENAIHTAKVLAGAALVLAALWGLSLLNSTN